MLHRPPPPFLLWPCMHYTVAHDAPPPTHTHTQDKKAASLGADELVALLKSEVSADDDVPQSAQVGRARGGGGGSRQRRLRHPPPLFPLVPP